MKKETKVVNVYEDSEDKEEVMEDYAIFGWEVESASYTEAGYEPVTTLTLKRNMEHKDFEKFKEFETEIKEIKNENDKKNFKLKELKNDIEKKKKSKNHTNFTMIFSILSALIGLISLRALFSEGEIGLFISFLLFSIFAFTNFHFYNKWKTYNQGLNNELSEKSRKISLEINKNWSEITKIREEAKDFYEGKKVKM